MTFSACWQTSGKSWATAGAGSRSKVKKNAMIRLLLKFFIVKKYITFVVTLKTGHLKQGEAG
jgi:hypothetical protein